MKTTLQTLGEMVDIAVAFNPTDGKVIITNNGTHVTVSHIVKKLKASEVTKDQIVELIMEKAEKYPEIDITYVEATEQK